MKFCLFLSGERGIVTLSHFLKSKIVPAEIYVAANRCRIRERASELVGSSVKVEVVSDVNDVSFVYYLNSLRLDFGVVAGFPTIFGEQLIKSTTYGMLNQHAGRLPAYRGGSPLNWQIINGEREIGISIIKMDEGIDSGAVIASDMFSLSVEEDISHAHMIANNLFGPLSLKAIDRLLSGNDLADETGCAGAYWHQRNDSDGLIHWDWMTAVEVVNLVRGVAPPYPGAFCFSTKGMIRVYSARVPNEFYRGTPGRAFFVQGKGPLVCTRDRAVLLQNYMVVPEAGDKMVASIQKLQTGDYLNRQPRI